MREILFRGKRIDNGEWAYGNYCKAEYLNPEFVKGCTAYEHFIIEIEAAGSQPLIDLKTVGQYTGLKDKNGKKIFEGDIVEFSNWGYKHFGKIVYNEAQTKFEIKYKRVVNLYALKFHNAKFQNLDLNLYETDYTEVIGNIHDNPELLNI